MLEYRWLFSLFLRSARCFTGAKVKWTLLPPISLPSLSPLLFTILKMLFKEHDYNKCDSKIINGILISIQNGMYVPLCIRALAEGIGIVKNLQPLGSTSVS